METAPSVVAMGDCVLAVLDRGRDKTVHRHFILLTENPPCLENHSVSVIEFTNVALPSLTVHIIPRRIRIVTDFNTMFYVVGVIGFSCIGENKTMVRNLLC